MFANKILFSPFAFILVPQGKNSILSLFMGLSYSKERWRIPLVLLLIAVILYM